MQNEANCTPLILLPNKPGKSTYALLCYTLFLSFARVNVTLKQFEGIY